MTFLIYFLAICNFAMAGIFYFFARDLRWEYEDDRLALVGFWGMITVSFLSAVLLLYLV